MSRLLCWPRETRRVCRARCRPAGRVLHRHANGRPAHLAGPDRRFVLDDPAHHRQRAPADVRGEAALQRRSRGADLEVPARARGGGVESAHRAGLPQPASGHGGYGEGAGRGVARPTLHDLRRRAADGELGPAPLAGDPRPGRRGVGLSARLDLLFRQGQARGHHAVPRRGIPPTMIRSTLSVTKRTSLASRGMVVAEHPRGAEVGARILARGGNAVDAAVATAFAMTVVEPFMSTIAGAGTMLVHLAKRGETVALDFNGMAPLRAQAMMYKTIGGVSEALFPWPNVEGQANVYGHRSVAVPGSVAGLALAVERYGTMTLADVMAPAIEIARSGLVPGRYRGLDLAFSPGATGGVTALETLNILAEFPSAKVGWTSVEGLHLRACAIKRAFRDRFEHLGDAAVVKAPWERLVSREHARAAAHEIRTGRSGARRPRGGRTLDCTTHVGAIDRQRNMVSLTNTAVSLWGSRVVVKGTGILLNNGMIWFDPEPGKANSIAGGKRGLVNMVPTLGFKGGKPYLTIGAPGGRAIVSAIPQVIANFVDGRGSLQQAVEAPRLHTEGGDVLVSTRVGEAALAGLAKRGHTVVPKEESYSTLNFARPIAIRVTPKGLEAGLEQFGMAWAAGH